MNRGSIRTPVSPTFHDCLPPQKTGHHAMHMYCTYNVLWIWHTNKTIHTLCVFILCQALTSHYLASLSDELCACGLHALALPVETLRLVAVDCLMGSRPASQLAHLRYVHVHLCTYTHMCTYTCAYMYIYTDHI